LTPKISSHGHTREVGDRLTEIVKELGKQAGIEWLLTENQVGYIHIAVRMKLNQ
jgi:hypothetical protein